MTTTEAELSTSTEKPQGEEIAKIPSDQVDKSIAEQSQSNVAIPKPEFLENLSKQIGELNQETQKDTENNRLPQGLESDQYLQGIIVSKGSQLQPDSDNEG